MTTVGTTKLSANLVSTILCAYGVFTVLYSSPDISFVGFSGKLVGHPKHSLAALCSHSSNQAEAVIKTGGGYTQSEMITYVKRRVC